MAMTEDFDKLRLRNNFYRDNYRRVLAALMASMLIILLMLGVIFYLITHRPAPKYFATTRHGKLMPISPLNRPNQSEPTVLQWASQAVVATYSLDYVHVRAQLTVASQFFTTQGWQVYITGLKQSGNLDKISDGHLIQHAVATGAPVIVQKAIIDGVYTWKIQMPILVVQESASSTQQTPLLVTLLIQRVSTADNPKGIQISQFSSARQD